jgi:4-amino-4-deoxy-L-arabinose transferase-like glycosyltransferase
VDRINGSSQFWTRHFWVGAAAVLIVAAFNLTFHVRDNAIAEWDESMYGQSAAEMIDTGDWIVTRRDGEVDLWLTKPPLMVWLIALSFHTLGVSALSLRLVSIVAAWLTVLVVMLWTRRIAGPLTAVAAGLVLATSFGFMFVHSGRTGNTDALFTLLITLTVVVLYASVARPWMRLVLGPLLAATFLLRGPGMLMPLALVVLFESWRRRDPARWPALAGALLLFAAPVGWWAVARWHADGWTFLTQVWTVDLVTRTLTPYEGHSGTPLYYFDILQRYHYDWLIAAAAAILLFPPTRARWREWLSIRSDDDTSKIVVMTWAVVTFGVPTLIQTKLSWYLNPFYPVFAVLVAGILHHALVSASGAPAKRAIAFAAILVVAVGTAEGKMLYQAYRRDTINGVQGLLERERSMLTGRTIFRAEWNAADRFVATRMVTANVAQVGPPDRFLEVAADGDFLIADPDLTHPQLEKVRAMADAALYRKK